MKLLLVIVLAISTTSAFSKEITLKGLKAKAVFDALTSDKKLSVFEDGGMGKIFIIMNSIDCFKNTASNNELMSCTFKARNGENTEEVILSSAENFEDVANIRFALANATGAETQVNSERKELKISNLECKYSGFNHVLDSNEIEIKYECKMSI